MPLLCMFEDELSCIVLGNEHIVSQTKETTLNHRNESFLKRIRTPPTHTHTPTPPHTHPHPPTHTHTLSHTHRHTHTPTHTHPHTHPHSHTPTHLHTHLHTHSHTHTHTYLSFLTGLNENANSFSATRWLF